MSQRFFEGEKKTLYFMNQRFPSYFVNGVEQYFQLSSNEDLVRFAESLKNNKAGLELEAPFELYHALFTKREFTFPQMERISAVVGKQNMPFVLQWNMQRLPTQKKRFGFLKRAFSEVLHHNKIMASGEKSMNLDEDDEDGSKLSHQLTTYNGLVASIARQKRIRMDSLAGLDKLLTLSCYLDDPNLSLRLQKSVLQKVLERGGRRQKQILFDDRRVQDYAAADAREQYLDQIVSDPRELNQIKDEVISRVEEVDTDAITPFIFAEATMEVLLKDKPRLLKILLESGESNEALRVYSAEKIYEAALGHRGLIKDGYESDIQLYPEDLSRLERYLYSLDYEGKALLAKDLLIGNEGVLRSAHARSSVLTWFFDRYVETPKTSSEESTYDLLRDVFKTVARRSKSVDLYFLVHPLITDRILGTPKREVGWENAKETAKRNLLADPDDYEPLWEVRDALAEIDLVFVGGTDDYMGEKETDPKKKETSYLQDYFSRYVNMVPETASSLPVIDFVKDLATKLGAPGVRFLQCLGIYVNLPEDLQEDFDDVYDNIRGQFKLSAVHTVSKELGEGLEGITRFGQRVGGGSLATVYKGIVHGRKAVIKVANPNVEYRAQKTCEGLKNILRHNDRLKRGIPIVEGIKKWIPHDVKYSNGRLDKQFRSQNNDFASEGNHYRIYVPEVFMRGERFMAEEFIDGENLTKWSELAKIHDMKAVVSLISRNVLYQVSQGLVHSDVHIGNLRVTEDQRIAWLDRTYLIKLDDQDKILLGSLYSGQYDAQTLSRYLHKFPVNRKMNVEGFERRLEEVGEQDTLSGSISSIVSAIYDSNGKLPLKTMLLAKNALAVDRMVKKAGFSGFAEALGYSE